MASKDDRPGGEVTIYDPGENAKEAVYRAHPRVIACGRIRADGTIDYARGVRAVDVLGVGIYKVTLEEKGVREDFVSATETNTVGTASVSVTDSDANGFMFFEVRTFNTVTSALMDESFRFMATTLR